MALSLTSLKGHCPLVGNGAAVAGIYVGDIKVSRRSGRDSVEFCMAEAHSRGDKEGRGAIIMIN